MENIVVIVVLALVLGLAVLYIRREKKRGKKCIGCPYSGNCGKTRNGSCGSHNP